MPAGISTRSSGTGTNHAAEPAIRHHASGIASRKIGTPPRANSRTARVNSTVGFGATPTSPTWVQPAPVSGPISG